MKVPPMEPGQGPTNSFIDPDDDHEINAKKSVRIRERCVAYPVVANDVAELAAH